MVQSGYVVGMAPSSSGDGVRFVRYSGTPQVDGSLPYMNCTNTNSSTALQGSLLFSNGVYYASCNENGIVAVT